MTAQDAVALQALAAAQRVLLEHQGPPDLTVEIGGEEIPCELEAWPCPSHLLARLMHESYAVVRLLACGQERSRHYAAGTLLLADLNLLTVHPGGSRGNVSSETC